MRTVILIVVVMICLWSTPLSAQEVTLSVTSEMETTSDPMILRLKVSNDTEQYVTINKVEAQLPPELYGGSPTQTWDAQFDLGKKQSKSIQVSVNPVPFKKRFTLAFHRPNTYQVLISAKYSVAGPTNLISTPQVEAAITPLAPAWAVFVGGIGGVFVIVLFKYLLKKNQSTESPQQRDASGQQARNVVPQSGEATVSVGGGAGVVAARDAVSTATPPKLWAAPALGIVVVFLSIMLFRFTASQFPDLPVTVSIKDVYGGFAIGLVFHTLTDFFKNALKP